VSGQIVAKHYYSIQLQIYLRGIVIMEQKGWVWFMSMCFGLLIGLYTAFVAMCLWNWFVVPMMNLSVIGFFHMLGIVWLIGLFAQESNQDDYKWRLLYAVLELCVPSDRRDELSETLHEQKDNIWGYVISTAFGKLIGNTTTLALGFGLHILIV